MLNNKGIDLSNEDNRYRIKELLNPYEYNIENSNKNKDLIEPNIIRSKCHENRNLKRTKK